MSNAGSLSGLLKHHEKFTIQRYHEVGLRSLGKKCSDELRARFLFKGFSALPSGFQRQVLRFIMFGDFA